MQKKQFFSFSLLYKKALLLLIILCNFSANCVQAQTPVLLLSDAIKSGLNNYQSIKAKRNYLSASSALVQNAKNQYLPDVIVSVQQTYGTINGQFGPSVALGGGISSAGPTNSKQSWNAAFGSVYLLNTNWEVISFGKLKSRIDVAGSQLKLDSANLLQEQFVHSIRIAGSYLNLLIAQRLVSNAKANLERALSVQQSVIARAKSGLVAGVDSSIANAELSAAKLSVYQAENYEQQLRNQFAQLQNIIAAEVVLDSAFFSNLPSGFITSFEITNNPQIKYYQGRIEQSNSVTNYLKKSIYPGLNLFGTLQSRGSGFDYNYSPDFTDRYTKNYFDGIKPMRYNYLAGLGLYWNLISPAKIKQQVKAQQALSAAYIDEYDLVTSQLKNQLILADQQIENCLKIVQEAPLQLKAASDAFLQKTVLYKNGLGNMVEVQQALYTLNRAQSDVDVSHINVWQALLLKAAATGDFDLFIKQVQ